MDAEIVRFWSDRKIIKIWCAIRMHGVALQTATSNKTDMGEERVSTRHRNRTAQQHC